MELIWHTTSAAAWLISCNSGPARGLITELEIRLSVIPNNTNLGVSYKGQSLLTQLMNMEISHNLNQTIAGKS